MYEALQSGSIPIYIYNDVPWLPYQSRLDWSEFAFGMCQAEGWAPPRDQLCDGCMTAAS